MKYKLLKDLPFMKAGEIFGKGSWVGGGFGVDRGETKYEGGGSSHNGVRTFDAHENAILQSLIDIPKGWDWVEPIPEHAGEALELFRAGRLPSGETIAIVQKFSK